MLIDGAPAPEPIVARLAALFRRLFGMPEYRRYVDHQRTHHPGCPVMSEREFVRAELERKYAGGGARCC